MEELQPTFYLGGQPYIFDDEVCKGGPEMAEAAFFETYRYVWFIFAEWCAGRISDAERLRQKTELYMGAFLLRDLMDRQGTLIPGSSLIIRH